VSASSSDIGAARARRAFSRTSATLLMPTTAVATGRASAKRRHSSIVHRPRRSRRPSAAVFIAITPMPRSISPGSTARWKLSW
jgi:hypothetical protein